MRYLYCSSVRKLKYEFSQRIGLTVPFQDLSCIPMIDILNDLILAFLRYHKRELILQQVVYFGELPLVRVLKTIPFFIHSRGYIHA